MGFVIDLDIAKCSACGACAVACMDQNDLDVDGGEQAFRVVSVVEDGPRCEYLSIACQHCEDAPCILACPCGCLLKDETTGFTVFDNNACIGCHSCAMACPFGAPCFNKDGKMQKCDGCAVRVHCGMEPACVAICPTGALRCLDEVALRGEKLAQSLLEITKAVLP